MRQGLVPGTVRMPCGTRTFGDTARHAATCLVGGSYRGSSRLRALVGPLACSPRGCAVYSVVNVLAEASSRHYRFFFGHFFVNKTPFQNVVLSGRIFFDQKLVFSKQKTKKTPQADPLTLIKHVFFTMFLIFFVPSILARRRRKSGKLAEISRN